MTEEDPLKVAIDILKAKYEASYREETFNLRNLLTNSVGVPEHGDLLGEADKIVEKIVHHKEKLVYTSSLLDLINKEEQVQKALDED